jgi:CHASE2 domain-containing sensor protein
MKPFPTGTKPGVFLQANYVQSILDHRFLREIPPALTLGFLVLFVFIVYCLYWAHDRDGRPRLDTEQAGLWSLALLAGTVLLSFLVLVATSYFTPLWALWGAGVFMVVRYLEASGHHRSERLMAQITGHREGAAAHLPVPAVPPHSDSDHGEPR